MKERGRKYKTPDAEIKISEEGFNSCLGREAVMTALHYTTKDSIRIVDLDKELAPYWQNDEATLVVEVRVSSADMKFAIQLADFMMTQGPDEFDTKPNGETVIMRFWWD